MRKRMSLRPFVVGVLALAAAACTELPRTAAVTVPPIPPGEARVWFYRDGGPYDGVGTPYLRMNEAIVGISEPGGASYRDVPAGPYHITVDSYGKDFNQDKNVQLSAGQELYVKIVSFMSRSCRCEPGLWAVAAAETAVAVATMSATPSMSG